MADSKAHDTWLREIDAASRAKQSAFLDGIAAKLGRPRVTQPPAHPFRGAPDFWRSFEWPPEERFERFRANFQAAGGHVVKLDDLEAAGRFIADKAAELGARRLLRQHVPELEALGLEHRIPEAEIRVWNEGAETDWKARAAEADIGIVTADYAAAYTGSVTVLSSPHKGRSVSLLPTVLFVILPVERLKTRLGETLERFDEAGRERLPAGIHFISGPSRSADIENDLTIGVHGPGVVFALVVG